MYLAQLGDSGIRSASSRKYLQEQICQGRRQVTETSDDA
jgi:hypothetical protein